MGKFNIDTALDFLWRKGIVASRDTDTWLTMKLDGEDFGIEIFEGMFTLVKKYRLGVDISQDILMQANNDTMLSRYCIKIMIRQCTNPEHTNEKFSDKEIVYSCEFLCSSQNEFEDQYEWAIFTILDGIRYHKQMYVRYAEFSAKAEKQYDWVKLFTKGGNS